VNRREWLAASGAALLAGGGLPALATCGETAAAGTRHESPRERIQRRYFPNIPLVTHDGREVRFYDDLVKDKIVTINMMYARCDGICMPTTMNLVKAQKLMREQFGARLGRDIHMYSITLRPKQDSPEVLKKYALSHGVGPGWTFLTGTPDDIEKLRQSLGFVDLDPEVDKLGLSHTGTLRYGNEPRTLWAACPGLSKPTAIAEALTWVDWPKAGPDAAAKGVQL
jgi:protein SCO1/2